MDDKIRNILVDYFHKKDFDEMINYCNSKIELDNSNFLLFGAKGKAFIEMKEFDNAIIDISRALELNPNYVLGLYNRGICYYSIERYDLAIRDLECAKLLNNKLDSLDFYLGGVIILLKSMMNQLSHFQIICYIMMMKLL